VWGQRAGDNLDTGSD